MRAPMGVNPLEVGATGLPSYTILAANVFPATGRTVCGWVREELPVLLDSGNIGELASIRPASPGLLLRITCAIAGIKGRMAINGGTKKLSNSESLDLILSQRVILPAGWGAGCGAGCGTGDIILCCAIKIACSIIAARRISCGINDLIPRQFFTICLAAL